MIDPKSSVPLGEQIERGIRRAIARGELKSGAELPSVRQLANDLEVNFNTVARAYRNLERDGLLYTRRGLGTRVLGTSETDPPKALTKAIEHVRLAVTDMRLAGLDRPAATALLEKEIASVWADNKEEN